jgi:hypothetical protein
MIMLPHTQTAEDNPPRLFKDRNEAKAIADANNAKPKSGDAHVQFSGYHDAYMVELRLKSNPYGNPAVLRVDGKYARYN